MSSVADMYVSSRLQWTCLILFSLCCCCLEEGPGKDFDYSLCWYVQNTHIYSIPDKKYFTFITSDCVIIHTHTLLSIGYAAVAWLAGTWVGGPEGPRLDKSILVYGLVAGKGVVSLLGLAELPLSKVPPPPHAALRAKQMASHSSLHSAYTRFWQQRPSSAY